MSETEELEGTDLSKEGLPVSEIPQGVLVKAHVGDNAVVAWQSDGQYFVTGGTCTHYGGPLGDGYFDGERIHCPWHLACFDARTGAVVSSPARDPLDAYAVEVRDGRLFASKVRERPGASSPPTNPPSVVIVGGGAAGSIAVETLRAEGYAGSITLVTQEDDLPYDRPNLSKDYLAGKAPEEWIPLRDSSFYEELGVSVIRNERAKTIDRANRELVLGGGRRLAFGALLIATGATPRRLEIPGDDLPHVHTLRSLADSRAIIADADPGQAAIVVGASFIGMEVAFSLRNRGLAVDVVAPESEPMERIIGTGLGSRVRELHEGHGVRFHLGHVLKSIDGDGVVLDDGSRLSAGLVVVGVGVDPAIELATTAGLGGKEGVTVDEFMETQISGIFAAGDVARWPWHVTNSPIRVEHWAVALDQGRVAARNILGRREPYRSVPFFWSQQFDVSLAYTGHAEKWDRIDVAGDPIRGEGLAAFRQGAKTLALLSTGREPDLARARIAIGDGDEATLNELVPGSG